MPDSPNSSISILQLGTALGWRAGSGDWDGVQTAIDRGEPVQVIQEAGSIDWQTQLPPQHPFSFGFPDYPPPAHQSQPPPPKARIWISPIQRRFSEDSDFPKVQWHPPVLWVGLGYRSGVSTEAIEWAIQQVCRSYHLAVAAIAGIATIDRKITDPPLRALCQRYFWQLQGFSAEQLHCIEVPTPSRSVETKTGTASVAEAAALLAAQTGSADSASFLRVRKQVLRQSDFNESAANATDRSGAITIAIAQTPLDIAVSR